ncbi:MAG: hypothetical protein ABJN26_28970 [Stappiaceae bacterium]
MIRKPHSFSPGSLLKRIPINIQNKIPGLLAIIGVSLLVALPTWVIAHEMMGPSTSLQERITVILLVLAFTTSVGVVVWMWRALLSRTQRDTPNNWEDWK